jgi:prolyl 4-hydroxylase
MTDPHLDARPSSAGDEEFAEAMRLFSSHPTPEQVTRATELLESASGQGCFAATEKLATFHAMAAGSPRGPQAWDDAFDALAAAAEQGSVAAGRQLLLLANPGDEPTIAPRLPPSDWREVRGRVSLDHLLRSPDRQIVRDTPRIRLIEGFASPAECRWVVDRSRHQLTRATIFDRERGGLVEDPARSNSAVSLMFEQMDVVTEMLRARIAAATGVPVRAFEPAQILRYQVGQEFVAHHDFLDAAKPGFREELAGHGQRIATFLIYLNEDYEGGETGFPAIGLRYRGRTGDAIFWANLDRQHKPDPLTLHAGLPPTSGEKWVFSQWIRERPAGAGG